MIKLNAHTPDLWKADVAKSVDLFNRWFVKFAPDAYQSVRLSTMQRIKDSLIKLGDFRDITPEMLMRNPETLSTLRMCTAPPLAKDRLIGLAQVNANLVKVLETGTIPKKVNAKNLESDLKKICKVLMELLDDDLFPWIKTNSIPTPEALSRASTIIADRFTGSMSDPLIRNTQEQRQLKLIENFLIKKGYVKASLERGKTFKDMQPGTFSFRLNVPVGKVRKVNIPIDVVIQPKKKAIFPILIEAKSAGDFTNTNKRRKEEAVKVHQLKETYGKDIDLLLFLCGYFDVGYLNYEATEGLDWIWEHRIEDLGKIV